MELPDVSDPASESSKRVKPPRPAAVTRPITQNARLAHAVDPGWHYARFNACAKMARCLGAVSRTCVDGPGLVYFIENRHQRPRPKMGGVACVSCREGPSRSRPT